MELCKLPDYLIHYRSSSQTYVVSRLIWHRHKSFERRFGRWRDFHEHDESFWESNTAIGWIGWDNIHGVI